MEGAQLCKRGDVKGKRESQGGREKATDGSEKVESSTGRQKERERERERVQISAYVVILVS